MQNAPAKFEPAAIADRLKSGWDSIPWLERKAAAVRAVDAISRDGAVDEVVALIAHLAEDPKWEVRKVIADGLLVLPETEFRRLTAKLLDDSNAYVKRAAERSLDRRQLGEKMADRRRRSGDAIRDQYAAISDRFGVKAADQSVKMALQMYDLFVGSSVHEMRNVLTPLKSSAQHIQKQLASGSFAGPEADRRLKTMVNWIEMLEQLLHDMRVYAQATPAGRQSERLATMVSEAKQLACEWFQGKGFDIGGIAIRMDVPDQIVVPVSRHQVVLSFKNILKNAIDAFATDPTTFRSGEITVTGRLQGNGQVELVFADSGMGLSPMELDELRRFIPGKSAKPHGSGYGLPTAQRRITEHGGTLMIDSIESRGTSIAVTLPLHAEGCE